MYLEEINEFGCVLNCLLDVICNRWGCLSVNLSLQIRIHLLSQQHGLNMARIRQAAQN